MFDMQKEDSGVSPVIGVILMVAVTVALVALVTVVVFDLGGDVSDSPDATVQLEQNSTAVQATLLRNENVDYLYLSDGTNDYPDSPSASNALSSAGDTLTTNAISSNGNVADGDTVNVIAVMPDGSEEVLTSTTFEN
jgi:flagellin-like protein